MNDPKQPEEAVHGQPPVTPGKRSWPIYGVIGAIIAVVIAGILFAANIGDREPREAISDAVSAFRATDSYRFRIENSGTIEYNFLSSQEDLPGLGELTTNPEEACAHLEGDDRQACLNYQAQLSAQLEAQQGQITGALPTQTVIEVTGDGVGQGANSQGTFDIRLEAGDVVNSGQFEIVTFEGKNYVREAGSETWVLMPEPEGGISVTTQSSALGNIDDTLTKMQEAGGVIEELGTREIDGVQARGYRARFDDASGLMGGALPEGADEGSLDETEVVVDVWVGSDDLIREISTDLSASSEGFAINSTFQMDLFEFGGGADIVEPTGAIPLEDVPEDERPFARLGASLGTTSND